MLARSRARGWVVAGERTEAEAGRDADLVAAAKRDRAAFAPLDQRYFDPVYRYCFHRLGSWDAAEDATSLVFAKALAGLPRCRDEAFRSWLFSIAHNVVVDVHRRRQPPHSTDALDGVIDQAPTPEGVVVAAAEHETVRALLARLPPEQRRIVELRLAGLTGPEIAGVLGRSVGAVKVAQLRAYARLRTIVGERVLGHEVGDGRG